MWILLLYYTQCSEAYWFYSICSNNETNVFVFVFVLYVDRV